MKAPLPPRAAQVGCTQKPAFWFSASTPQSYSKHPPLLRVLPRRKVGVRSPAKAPDVSFLSACLFRSISHPPSSCKSSGPSGYPHSFERSTRNTKEKNEHLEPALSADENVYRNWVRCVALRSCLLARFRSHEILAVLAALKRSRMI